jgi:hypothetical protein
MTQQKIHEVSKQKEDNLLKLCPNLTLPQAELLMGGLLGDANLQTASKTAGTWRARRPATQAQGQGRPLGRAALAAAPPREGGPHDFFKVKDKKLICSINTKF